MHVLKRSPMVRSAHLAALSTACMLLAGCGDLSNDPVRSVSLIAGTTHTQLRTVADDPLQLKMTLESGQFFQFRAWSLAKLVGLDVTVVDPDGQEIWSETSPGTALRLNAVRAEKSGTYVLTASWLTGSGVANYRYTLLPTKPSKLTSTDTITMSSGRAFHQATALEDGSVLITGGMADNQPLSSSEIINIGEASAQPVNPMKLARAHHSAARITAGSPTLIGKVLLAGGLGKTGDALSSTEIYSPTTKSFTPGPYLPEPRAFMGIAAIDQVNSQESFLNGKIVVLGGENTRTAPQHDPNDFRYSEVDENAKDIWYFDPVTANDDKEFRKIPVQLSVGRIQPAVAFLPNVRVDNETHGWLLIMGGGVDSLPTSPGCDIGTLDGTCYCTSPDVPLCTFFYGEGSDKKHINYVRKDRATDLVEVYDITSGDLFVLKNRMIRARVNHAVAVLPDGRVLIAGGSTAMRRTFNSTEKSLPEYPSTIDSVEIFDPDQVDSANNRGTFTLLPPLAVPREKHHAAVMADGSVLLVGGLNEVPGGTRALRIIEQFEPSLNQMVVIDSLETARTAPSVTVLESGKRLLVTGGLDGETSVRTGETRNLNVGE